MATTSPRRAIFCSVLGWTLSSASAYSLSSSGSNSLVGAAAEPGARSCLLCSSSMGFVRRACATAQQPDTMGALIVVSPENQLGQTGGLHDKSFEGGEVVARIPHGDR